LPLPEAKMLLRDLVEHAAQREYIYPTTGGPA
jgi:hypothetical protein